MPEYTPTPPPAPPQKTPTPTPLRKVPPRRRGLLGQLGPVTVLLAAAAVGLGALAMTVTRSIGRRPHPVRANVSGTVAGAKPLATAVSVRPLAPEVESRIFEVAEATGRVEALRGDKWVVVASGDVLTEEDLVRTGTGRAVLRLGSRSNETGAAAGAGATEIELRERVEIRLDSVSRAGASLALRRGKVVARVETGRSVAITSAETKTANEGGLAARFVVTADERGRVAVAATEGAVRFEAAGRAVKVGAGTATHADRGQPPSDPEKITEDVFLSVVWPAGDRRDDRAPVSGKVEPGSVVRVNGAPAEADQAGRFQAAVPIRDGINSVEVEVEDVAGRTRREKRDVRRIPSRRPDLAAEPAELWNQPP